MSEQILEHFGIIMDSHRHKGSFLGNRMGCIDSLRWTTPETVVSEEKWSSCHVTTTSLISSSGVAALTRRKKKIQLRALRGQAVIMTVVLAPVVSCFMTQEVHSLTENMIRVCLKQNDVMR